MSEKPEPEKLNLASEDVAERKRQELLALFPEVRTEGGKVDFDRLKLALGAAVDVGKERYGLTWPGKADCFRTIQAPSVATLRPAPKESVNFDSTENLIIEGDNLEVLKLLQKSYLGRVKTVYIDPPYNTGNDFIYPDNFSESLQTYLQYTGQADAQGKKFGTNTETDGRFHSKWLNMMYPRLYLSRNLLANDGVLLASVDDQELGGLRHLCDQIFGEENFVGIVVWKGATDNNPTRIATEHEYVVCYARSKEAVPSEWKRVEDDAKQILLAEFGRLKKQQLKDTDLQARLREFIKARRCDLPGITHYDRVDGRGVYTGSRKVHNPKPGGYVYDVLHPVTKKVCVPPVNGYRYPEERMRQLIAEDRILFGEDESQIVQIKEYLTDYEAKLSSVVTLDSRAGSNELQSLMGVQKLFPHPKPTELLRGLFEFVLPKDGLLLDFFAGSGSSAQAVLDLNRKDGGSRSFILVQLPEPLDPSNKEQKTAASFCDSLTRPRSIAEITKERVRRVIKNLDAQETKAKKQLALTEKTSAPLPKQDRGFRVFKLAESNFKPWNTEAPKDANGLDSQLALHIDHLREDRSDADLLFEILLKSGFPLTTPVESFRLADKVVSSVGEGALLVCFDRKLTIEVIRAMADRKPERVVCLDAGFDGSDQLKANAVQIFKTKGVVSFKTI